MPDPPSESETHLREREIFCDALNIDDPDAREAFLEKACGGDQALRSRIGRLLDQDTATFLKEPAGDLTLDPSLFHRGESITYFGDYELLEEIDRGAMGVVYRARQSSLNRPVALKMIRGAHLSSESEMRRFRAEAEAAAALDHPNIVPIYEIGEHQDQHYFSMKLIPGGSLQKRAGDFKGDPKATAQFVATAARAIHAAHQHGILHRDIKPGNILLDAEGQPQITDFGVSRPLGEKSELTLTGEVVGTPVYMAPEQARGETKELTTAADVYSLGAVLYELLSGEKPIPGETIAEILRSVEEAPPRPLRSISPFIARDLETVVMKCLEKKPDDRYPSAAAFADDLDRWLRREPILARPAQPAERLVKWVRRKPVHAALLATAAALVLLLAIGGPIIAFRQATLKKQAIDQGKALQRSLYVAKMNLASDAFEKIGGAEHVARFLSETVPELGAPDLRGWEWYYLRSQFVGEKKVFQSDPTAAKGAAWNGDGTRLAVLRNNTSVDVIDAKSGARLLNLKGLDNSGTSVQWSPDSSRIAACCTHGKTFAIWDAKSGELLLHIQTKLNDHIGLDWSPDGKFLATVGFDKLLKIWDAKSGEPRLTLSGHKGRIRNVAWHQDGRHLATVAEDGLKIWEIGSEAPLASPSSENTYDVAWSPDGTKIAVCGNDISVWELASKKRVLSIPEAGSGSALLSVAWSPDGKALISAGEDESVTVWDADTGRRIVRFLGHSNKVFSVAPNPSGSLIASASQDGTVRLWDATAKDPNRRIHHGAPITEFAFSQDGKEIARTGQNRTFHIDIWDLKTRSLQRQLFGHEAFPKTVSWSPDGRKIAASAADRTVRIWNAATGDQIQLLPTPKDWGGKAVPWSPDGSLIASIGGNKAIRVWNSDTGEKVLNLKMSRPLSDVSWHPNSKLVAVVGQAKEVAIIDIPSKTMIHQYPTGQRQLVRCVRWSPGGDRIAAGSSDETIVILDPKSGQIEHRLAEHTKSIESLAWSPDGTRLLSGGAEGEVKIWDIESGKKLLNFRDHAPESRITHVAWSPDGKIAASSDSAGLIILRDATSGYQRAPK